MLGIQRYPGQEGESTLQTAHRRAENQRIRVWWE
jgi:hypothetical protein